MLGDDIAWALPKLRDHAESLMLDRCTITRLDPNSEPGEMDPETGQYPESARTEVYAGKCRVQANSVIASASDSNAGERPGTTQELELQIPIVGTETVSVGDVVEVTAAVMDSALQGRVYTITAPHEKSQASARRLRIERVTS